MIKRIIFIVLSVTVFVLSACKENSKKNLVSLPYPVYKIFPSNWEEVSKKENIFIAEFKGERYVYFIGKGQSIYAIDAKNKAQIDAYMCIASSIKNSLKEKLDAVKQQLKKMNITEKIKNYIEQKISENVDVSGIIAFKSKIFSRITSKKHTLYNAIIIYGLPERVFLKKKKESFEKDHIKEVMPTPGSRVGKTFL